MDDTATADQIAEIRSARLHRTMQAVAAAHPFYRTVLADAGLTADDFRAIDDLEKLPLTSKQDYISDPQAFRLDADALPDDFGLEERVIWDIAYTSGTTGGNRRRSTIRRMTYTAFSIRRGVATMPRD